MFFDGAARCNGAGAGVVFISLEGEVMPFAFNLKELSPIMQRNIKL